MQCRVCGATFARWSTSPLCPACHAVDAQLPVPESRQRRSFLWLWTSDQARSALATGDLAVIMRTYRTVTGTSQRQLAELLGYDTTYISMIETGRREINDVAARLRIARYLGIPPHVLGVSDPSDADFTAMLQFGESTIRLAVIARQAGHGTDAVNELWPVVTRLEARVAEGHNEWDVLHLLARARAEFGVSLGYVLPEERLASATRWTGRALWLAERLDDTELLAMTLRVHGNELRKIGHIPAAVSRLHRAIGLTSDRDRCAVLVQLARATAELGNRTLFDATIEGAGEVASRSAERVGLSSRYAVHEAHLRGLVATGRPDVAIGLLDRHIPTATAPPQWHAMANVTHGEVLLAATDIRHASTAFQDAIEIAERHRLPHQIQRVLRACTARLPETRDRALAALARLSLRS
jgi:transcriptional regulator with XRE-family HTH domain